MSTVKSSSEDLTLNADGAGNDVVLQSNGTTKAIVTAEGNVGIGTSSPNYPLDIEAGTLGGTSGDTLNLLELKYLNNNSSYLRFEGLRTATGTDWNSAGTRIQQVIDTTDMGYIQFNGTGNSYGISFGSGSTERMLLDSSGNLHADGDVTAYSTTTSDVRLKSDIEPITDALSKVNQLSGYTFTRNHNGQKSAGILAHELEKVLPEAVREKELPLQQDDGKKYKVVEYDAIQGLLIEAINELSGKVKELESKISSKES